MAVEERVPAAREALLRAAVHPGLQSKRMLRDHAGHGCVRSHVLSPFGRCPRVVSVRRRRLVLLDRVAAALRSVACARSSRARVLYAHGSMHAKPRGC